MSNSVVSSMQTDDAVVKATADSQHEQVSYRIVSDQEILKLAPLFKALNWPTPDPDFAKILVAEAGLGNDKVILGFVVAQFLPHVEPMWVHPNLRGTGVAEELSRQVTHYMENDCHQQRYLCVAKDGSFAARLAAARGMRLLPGYQVFIRDVSVSDKEKGS